MKRSGIEAGHGSPKQSGGGRPRLSRTAGIKASLSTDGVQRSEYPDSGRVREYLDSEHYQHDPKDEQAIVDWCVQRQANITLCNAIQDWRPQALSFKACRGQLVLEDALPAALKASTRHIALIDCAPLGSSGGASQDSDDSADGERSCEQIVDCLVALAWTGESLSMERCSLLSGPELARCWRRAAEASSLQRLSLCEVAGVDGEVLASLAQLVQTSRLQHLQLGGLTPAAQPGCVALAEAIGRSELHTLELTHNDTQLLLQLLMRLAALPVEFPLRLQRLVLLQHIPQAPDDAASGEDGEAQLVWQLAQLQARCPALVIDHDIQLVPAPASQPIEQSAPTPLHPPLAIRDTGLSSHPRFLQRIGSGLRLFKLDPQTPVMGQPGVALRVLPPLAGLRIAFELSGGDGTLLRWIRLIDRHHRALWDRASQNQQTHRDNRPARVTERIQRLLKRRDTAALFAYAVKLRAQGRTPTLAVLDQLNRGCQHDEPRRKGFVLAFNPLGQLDRLAKAQSLDELDDCVALLREHAAVPAAEALAPLISAHVDNGGVLEVLSRLLED